MAHYTAVFQEHKEAQAGALEQQLLQVVNAAMLTLAVPHHCSETLFFVIFPNGRELCCCTTFRRRCQSLGANIEGTSDAITMVQVVAFATEYHSQQLLVLLFYLTIGGISSLRVECLAPLQIPASVHKRVKYIAKVLQALTVITHTVFSTSAAHSSQNGTSWAIRNLSVPSMKGVGSRSSFFGPLATVHA